jgi:hypothetical protein
VAAGLEHGATLQAAWPLAGGVPRALKGLRPGDWVVRWSGDGRHVFSRTYDEHLRAIARVRKNK